MWSDRTLCIRWNDGAVVGNRGEAVDRRQRLLRGSRSLGHERVVLGGAYGWVFGVHFASRLQRSMDHAMLIEWHRAIRLFVSDRLEVDGDVLGCFAGSADAALQRRAGRCLSAANDHESDRHREDELLNLCRPCHFRYPPEPDPRRIGLSRSKAMKRNDKATRAVFIRDTALPLQFEASLAADGTVSAPQVRMLQIETQNLEQIPAFVIGSFGRECLWSE